MSNISFTHQFWTNPCHDIMLRIITHHANTNDTTNEKSCPVAPFEKHFMFLLRLGVTIPNMK